MGESWLVGIKLCAGLIGPGGIGRSDERRFAAGGELELWGARWGQVVG